MSGIVVDAGPLIAGFDRSDTWHDRYSELLTTLPGPLLVPSTIVAEVCYMIARHKFGAEAEAAFLRSFSDGSLVLAELVVSDFARMADLVVRYADFPLGGSDASVIAIAERLSLTTFLTTDRRHFAAVRPSHVEAFTLLP
ncbi:PIN domain-containing protein [Pseudonocardia sp. Ae707_Ps2]